MNSFLTGRTDLFRDQDLMDHESLLKTLLHGLKDGVVVCDPEATIILFNQAAEALFGPGNMRRQSQSLYNLCYRPPVEQALNFLNYQHSPADRAEPLPYFQFMNKAVGREQYLRCRVSFLPSEEITRKSFVMIFEDISAWYTPGNPLLDKIEEIRVPMTNLRAAVESLTEYPEMSPVMRTAFENVLVQETINLAEVFNGLAHSCNSLMQTQNYLMTLKVDSLFAYLKRHLDKQNLPLGSPALQDTLVKVDIYGLLLILDFLIAKLVQSRAGKKLACEIQTSEQFIFVDFIWQGQIMATTAVKNLLEEKLDHSLGKMTVAAILHTMEGDIWSQQLNSKKSMLRLALPVAAGAGH